MNEDEIRSHHRGSAHRPLCSRQTWVHNVFSTVGVLRQPSQTGSSHLTELMLLTRIIVKLQEHVLKIRLEHLENGPVGAHFAKKNPQRYGEPASQMSLEPSHKLDLSLTRLMNKAESNMMLET